MSTDAFLAAVAPLGLNLSGVVSVADWDREMPPTRVGEALLPGARSILVLGSGGGNLWRSFLADLERDPRGLAEEEHPFDAYVRRVVLGADSLLFGRRRWFWAAGDAEVHIDFRVLAALGRLGTASRMGLLIHPRYGTWLGLRAACVMEAELAPSVETAPDICAGCPAPCVAACPGSAFPEGRWSVDRCSAFHRESDVCERTCHARMACPAGEERYPPEEIAYHYHRESGRVWLRRHLGIPDQADRYSGVGPHWGDWKKRVDVKGEKTS